jgi:hypothetical protein
MCSDYGGQSLDIHNKVALMAMLCVYLLTLHCSDVLTGQKGSQIVENSRSVAGY